MDLIRKKEEMITDPRIGAAFHVAEKAYANIVRRSGLTGISHPMMMVGMLDMFDRKDYLRHMRLPENAMNDDQYQEKKIFLKVTGMLHDALEDNPEYKADYERFKSGMVEQPLLKSDYIEQLINTSQPKTAEELHALTVFGEHVFASVEQMTNDIKIVSEPTPEKGGGAPEIAGDQVLVIDKRTIQADAVKLMDPDTQILKSLDQTSSMVEDILFSDPTNKKNLVKNHNFAHKAVDISRICRGDNHDSPFHELCKRVFDKSHRLYKLAYAGKFDQVELLRKNFDIRQELDTARNTPPEERIKVSAEEVLDITNPAFDSLNKGLAGVTFSEKTGKVVGLYGVVTDEASSANAAFATLRKLLEVRHGSAVNTHGTKKHSVKEGITTEHPGGKKVGYLAINPPRLLRHFIKIAKMANAVDPDFVTHLNHVAIENGWPVDKHKNLTPISLIERAHERSEQALSSSQDRGR